MTAQPSVSAYHPLVIWAARFVSWIFHPLFTGLMMMYYIVFINPTIFLAASESARLLKFLTFTSNNFVFPVLIVLLLRGLGFSKSIQLDTQKERIVPYMASITFFFWTYYVFKNQSDAPLILTDMCQGIFLASSVALVLNSFLKISMHAIGVGGMLGLMYVVLASGYAESAWPLMASILLTGLVCTSRLIVSNHTSAEIIVGLLTGVGTQMFSYWV